MLREHTVKVVALLTCAVMTVAAIAQTQGGMLTATAGVTVNGKAAPTNVDTAVLPGDRILTGTGSAQVRLEGSLIQLGPATSMTIAEIPEFGCGQLSYFALRGAPLRVGGLEFKPSVSEETKVHIVHAAGTITIAVAAGSILFSTNDQATTLRTGESTTIADKADCPAIPPGSGASPAAQSALRNPKVIGAIAGGGGAAALIGILATRSKQPASPSRP